MAAAAYRVVRAERPARSWLVMLHGATQHCGLFDTQEAHFRRDRHLLLVDLPGHGRSSHLPGPYGLVEYATSVSRALDEAGVGDAHFWGTHTGAAVGLLLAAETPRKFRSLVLEGAVLPGRAMPYVASAFARAVDVTKRHGVEAAKRDWFETAAFFDAIRADPVACRSEQHARLLGDFAGGPWIDTAVPATVPDLTGRLGTFPMPTLLVNGEHDLTDFLATADFLASALPEARRATIATAGAFPLWERPQLVNPLVESWVNRVDEAATK
ncbi:MAG: alpha/beta fold hydrolase [Enhydrobacter sp.]|nr:MAG: alpha/beta fold hydrolase [Enhydrobacter sp.]